MPLAISDRPGEASFYASAEEGFSRLGDPNPFLAAPTTEVRVRVSSIDAFCAERGQRPDWIVLDVEGYEVAALRGSRTTISSGRGRLGLIVEMHPDVWSISGASREMLADLLRTLGLTPVPLTGQADPLGEYGIVLLEYI